MKLYKLVWYFFELPTNSYEFSNIKTIYKSYSEITFEKEKDFY
jgi:hypothetical protein